MWKESIYDELSSRFASKSWCILRTLWWRPCWSDTSTWRCPFKSSRRSRKSFSTCHRCPCLLRVPPFLSSVETKTWTTSRCVVSGWRSFYHENRSHLNPEELCVFCTRWHPRRRWRGGGDSERSRLVHQGALQVRRDGGFGPRPFHEGRSGSRSEKLLNARGGRGNGLSFPELGGVRTRPKWTHKHRIRRTDVSRWLTRV